MFIKAGHIIGKKQHDSLKKELRQYCLQITDKFFLGPLEGKEIQEIAIFINHSCDPNVAPDGQIVFKTIKDIKAGQELCHDYAMDTDREYRLKCECGSKKCRGVVTGKDWQKEELQERYGEHFSDFILEKIKG